MSKSCSDNTTQRPRVKYTDRVGKTFERLTIVELIMGREVKSRCLCQCGSEIVVHLKNVIYARTKSCGCLNKELARARKHSVSHGASRSRLYAIWQSMRQRCENPRHHAYSDYGGRGIRVCPEWASSFVSFQEAVGPRPPGSSLDRIDNDKGYSPGNCRWSTPREQQRNRRVNRLITYNGVTKCLAEWADIYGLTYECLRQRICYRNKPLHEAFTTPRQIRSARKGITTK